MFFLILLSICLCYSKEHYRDTTYIHAFKFIDALENQNQHNYRGSGYYEYSFHPISLFPLFCLQDKVVDKFMSQNPKDVIYLTDLINFYRTIEKSSVTFTRLYIGVVHYIQIGRSYPVKKYYTLYTCMSTDNKSWFIDKTPLTVTLILTDRFKHLYGCK